MKLTTLDKLFHHELKDLYDAEHQIVKALPKMVETACSEELSQAFAEHLEQTKGHIGRVDLRRAVLLERGTAGESLTHRCVSTHSWGLG